MRFENMTNEQQEENLNRLFTTLRNKIYLKEIDNVPVFLGGNEEKLLIDVLDTPKEALAGYISLKELKQVCPDMVAVLEENANWHSIGVIVIRQCVIEVIKALNTQKDQISVLAAILLHEMAHLFCDMHDIADHTHGTKWQVVALTHGCLFHPNVGPAGLCLITDEAVDAISNFRYR